MRRRTGARCRFGLALALVLGSACHARSIEAPEGRRWSEKRRPRRSTPMPLVRTPSQVGSPTPVMDVLIDELETNFVQLQDSSLDLPAYFLAYQLYDTETMWLVAEGGGLVIDEREHERNVDVDVRVGTPRFDNSHTRVGRYGGNGLGSGLPVAIDDHALSLAQGLWLDTDAQYQAAVEAYRQIESDESLRTEDELEHPDFSEEEPVSHFEPVHELAFEEIRAAYRPAVAAISTTLADAPEVLTSNVVLSAVAENRVFVSSEGARVQTGATQLRVLLDVQAQAEDGMVLERTATFEARHPDELLDRAALERAAVQLREEVLALRNAPIAEPYTGPAILEGRAAGVFFHEIFGHRLEGHRQKDDLEGQTFTDRLQELVLPRFLDVVDDPTASSWGEVPLSGHYIVDDEGVAARPTRLVDRGKLTGFLLGRSPVLPFVRSNGHGRRAPGHQALPRQGNFIVSSRRAWSSKQLRGALIEEIKRQNKPYGLRFEDIEGGYTMTARSGPQAFKVEPLMVYRVFADGRPDELVRGVELVGTPLSAFETIIATDDQPQVFNGMCGAESGWVPVSAVSPALLLRNIEIERAMHERERPPLLSPPSTLEGGRP